MKAMSFFLILALSSPASAQTTPSDDDVRNAAALCGGHLKWNGPGRPATYESGFEQCDAIVAENQRRLANAIAAQAAASAAAISDLARLLAAPK